MVFSYFFLMKRGKQKAPLTKRNTSRIFLSPEKIQEIIALHKQGMKLEEIIKKTGAKERAIMEHIHEHECGQFNIWSPQEDEILIKNYEKGIIRPAKLSRILTAKAPWMIRNRIKNFKKKNVFGKNKELEVSFNVQINEEKQNDILVGLNTELLEMDTKFAFDGMFDYDQNFVSSNISSTDYLFQMDP